MNFVGFDWLRLKMEICVKKTLHELNLAGRKAEEAGFLLFLKKIIVLFLFFQDLFFDSFISCNWISSLIFHSICIWRFVCLLWWNWWCAHISQTHDSCMFRHKLMCGIWWFHPICYFVVWFVNVNVKLWGGTKRRSGLRA